MASGGSNTTQKKLDDFFPSKAANKTNNNSANDGGNDIIDLTGGGTSASKKERKANNTPTRTNNNSETKKTNGTSNQSQNVVTFNLKAPPKKPTSSSSATAILANYHSQYETPNRGITNHNGGVARGRINPLSSSAHRASAAKNTTKISNVNGNTPTSSTSTAVNRISNKCSFCQKENAAVIVQRRSKSKNKQKGGGILHRNNNQNSSASSTASSNDITEEPLCLIHYYTTRACRMDPTKITPFPPSKPDNASSSSSSLSSSELDMQLPYMQQLFSEAFLELQSQIGEESARSFRKTSKDPLSILSSFDSRKSRSIGSNSGVDGGSASIGAKRRINAISTKHTQIKRRNESKILTKKNGDSRNLNSEQEEEEEGGGGFIQQLASKEKQLIKEQERRIQESPISPTVERTKRKNRTYPGSTATMTTSNLPRSHISKRRKTQQNFMHRLSREQNSSTQETRVGKTDKTVSTSKGAISDSNGKQQGSSTINKRIPNGERCVGMSCEVCKSDQVEIVGNITGRNNDVNKADIWGYKKESDVTIRYQCLKCSRIWSEIE